MSSILRYRSHGCVAMILMALAGCSKEIEPAQRSIIDIEAIVSAASADAQQYVPDQYADTRIKLGELRVSFDKGDYATVLRKAPAVMSEAQGLAGAAAAKKDELAQAKVLNEQWSGFAAEVPTTMTAIQGHLDALRKTGRNVVSGVNLDSARGRLSSAETLWSKAQAAFATGNMTEAVSAAKTVDTSLQALVLALKMDVAAPPAAPKAASPSTG
jgi:hypothetical protein